MATKKTKRTAAKKKLVTKKLATKKPAPKKPAMKKKPAPAKKLAAKRPAKKLATKAKATTKKKASPVKAPAKKKPAKKPAAVRRRDGAGHLDPKYAATLRAKSREGQVKDPDEAFIGRSGRAKDDLAEEMGEVWVETATSGEDEREEAFDQDVPEDAGGPFVTTTESQEFAAGTDASNPKGAKREPFPTT